MNAANPFLIGTDPEFAILDRGHLVTALLPQGKLGTDHGGRVVELRPDPKQLASLLCADIFRQLNRSELVPYRRYHWKAGGMAAGQPIGGHVHLDVPFQAPAAGDQRLSALDRMAEWFETVELFPQDECQARIREGYGSRSNSDRVRAAGRRPDGHPRLEYRTPPSWLYSPRLAHLTLAAFKLALVDPQHTLDSLDSPDVRPVGKFRDFIRGFVEADDDAAELAPQLAKRGGLEAFRGDPNDDIKEAWGISAAPSESEPATTETVVVNTPTSPTAYYDPRTLDNLRMQLGMPIYR